MRPMLATAVKDVHNDISYPVLVSPKLDGFRCLIVNGSPLSRNGKLIRNDTTRDILTGLPAMDGELIVGNPRAKDAYLRTSSEMASRDGAPKFTFWVFDALTVAPMGFSQRLELAKSYANASGNTVQFVEHKLIKTAEGLLEYEAKMLLAGYEGVMIRDPSGLYKQGRSTLREGGLLKLKRFEDAEAEVIGFVEKEHNDNVLEKDAHGRAKRSSHKSGKRAAGTLGALICKTSSNVEFRLGVGFDESQRVDIWERRGSLLGRLVKFRFQPAGVKEAPRFPVFLGWRDASDT